VDPEVLYHIAEPGPWGKAQRIGLYRPPSLDDEGYIHLSKEEQVVDTANRHFAGRTDLVLVQLDPRALPPKLKWEEGEPGEIYPHFYAPLPLGAVVHAGPWKPGSDGAFSDPPKR
jgi:uncharacterized protein (DUF952 family)